MKKLFFAGIIFLAACAPSVYMLPITPIKQEQPRWCWAASIEMAVQVYGYEAKQCDILNFNLGQNSCCKNPEKCNLPAAPNEIVDVLQNRFGLMAVARRGALPMFLVKHKISKEESFLMIVRDRREGTKTRHVLVAVGYIDNKMMVVDPWDASVSVMPYESFFNKTFEWQWEDTVVIEGGLNE